MKWTWTLEAGAYVLRPDRLPPGVEAHGVVGRTPGGPGPLAGRETVRLEQVHGAAVAEASAPGLHAACDAVVSRRPGLILTVRVADCLPVLLASPTEGAALIHAGWRGLTGGVLEAAAARFRRPGELHALLGPALGPCCFEVGPEVADLFPGKTVRALPGARPRVDLARAAALRLIAAGVPPERISPPGPCTRCHQHLLFSHRGGGGAPGRNLVFAVVGEGEARHEHDA